MPRGRLEERAEFAPLRVVPEAILLIGERGHGLLDDLLGIWPSHAELTRDLGFTNPKHVSVMVQRQRISDRFWTAIIDAAAKRAKAARKAGDVELAKRFEQVTADSLLKLHDALDAARKK